MVSMVIIAVISVRIIVTNGSHYHFCSYDTYLITIFIIINILFIYHHQYHSHYNHHNYHNYPYHNYHNYLACDKIINVMLTYI